jgi:hypothetical protein
MLKGPAASALFYFAVAAPLQGQRYIRRRAYRTGFTITGHQSVRVTEKHYAP